MIHNRIGMGSRLATTAMMGALASLGMGPLGAPSLGFEGLGTFNDWGLPYGEKPFVLPEDMDTPELASANEKIRLAKEKLEKEKIEKARLKKERKNK